MAYSGLKDAQEAYEFAKITPVRSHRQDAEAIKIMEQDLANSIEAFSQLKLQLQQAPSCWTAPKVEPEDDEDRAERTAKRAHSELAEPVQAQASTSEAGGLPAEAEVNAPETALD